MSILITVIILGLVIFVHELGHLCLAKRGGVGVQEFSVGMGPKVWSKKYKETLYCLRILPFGGFIKIDGLDDTENPINEEKNFLNKSFSTKFLTISAGSLINIFTGLVIFWLVACFIGMPVVSNKIIQVFPNTPAQKSGLKVGDIITEINGRKIKNVESDLIKVIHKANNSLVITYTRNNNIFSVSIHPELNPKIANYSTIGVAFASEIIKANPVKALFFSLEETGNNIKLVFVGLKMLFTGEAKIKDLAGPIGIIQFTSFQLQKGWLEFILIIAMISINLGVVNLFPIPGLDGGYLVIFTIEAILRKPISEKTKQAITQVSFAFLIILMVMIIFNDIINLDDRIRLLKGLSGK